MEKRNYSTGREVNPNSGKNASDSASTYPYWGFPKIDTLCEKD